MSIKFLPNTINSPNFQQLDIDTKFITALKVYGDKGNLAYEYNPLRNLRLEYDLYDQDDLGRLINSNKEPIIYSYSYINENGVTIIEQIGLTHNNIYNLITSNVFNLTNSELENSDTITEALINLGLDLIVTARAGTLIDFETDLLKLDLNNPVQIECQPSYDGSINLILNDDLNVPRLINSRFIALEGNTYKVANRKGNNDTNIYDDESFDIDTSLYKRITKIPNLIFVGLQSGGNMKCGNYNFYFKFADVDGNETDFVAESRQVICHIGSLNDPFSIRAGLRDETSNKIVQFQMSNIDTSYDYITVYFTRKTGDTDGTPIIEAGKIDRKFNISQKGTVDIIITGFEEIEDKTIEDINIQYNVVNSAKTQAQSQNMLFMGNVHKPDIPYEELEDLALRIYPTAYIDDNSIGRISNSYIDDSTVVNKYEYYNVKNIYDKVSYWNKEIYRFGVVFILNDYTLSPVFNIRGKDNLSIFDDTINTLNNQYTLYPVYNPKVDQTTGEKTRNYIEVNDDYSIGKSEHYLENSKGVIRFNLNTDDKFIVNKDGETTPLGIKFYIPEDVFAELNKYCKGFFIVRQKRIPTILAQALTIGLDRSANVPLIPTNDDPVKPYITERFINDDRELVHYYEDRIYKQESNKIDIKAAICPEYQLRSSLFNQLFTGNNYNISESILQPAEKHFYPDGSMEGRSYKINSYTINNTSAGDIINNIKLTAVQDNIKVKTSGTQRYSSRAGEAEEAWRLSYLWKEETSEKATNITRGSWGPYLGMENYHIPMRIIDIHIPGYSLSLMEEYFKIRYNDDNPYHPIMHRMSFENVPSEYVTDLDTGDKYNNILKYGGDCYVCNFTHRMMRNFQDPETPVNDQIVEKNTFKDKFSIDDQTKCKEINRADVNAVKIGHWVTFKVLSNYNLNFRDVDSSWFTEEGITGKPRNFYPLYSKSYAGEDKMPESNIISGGVSSTLSEKYNYLLPDVPYIKNEFDTRIMYSDIHINDAFKNGYRVFKLTNYRDYTKEFGAITKLVTWFGDIVCVFEHGVVIIPVNERVLSGEGSGGSVFINTNNVLPENPKVLSRTFGSGWIDSIIPTETYIYGVDTVGKKIWRTNGEGFEVISDFKIQKFLNDNITLKERELTPTIGVRNVKSHYNAFKKDVMFTFYDDLHGFEENVWNICYNEIQEKWITFYSWLPSASENIDNIYFSFDRTTAKWISKLGKSNSESTYADGICLDNVIFTKDGIDPSEAVNFIGNCALQNRNTPIIPGKTNVAIKYELLEDSFGNYQYFKLEDIYDNNFQTGFNRDGSKLIETILNGAKLYYTEDYNDYIYNESSGNKKVYLLNMKVTFTYYIFKNNDANAKQFTEKFTTYQTVNGGYFENSIAVAPYDNIQLLTTDFWKHGQAGIMDVADEIVPTKWYGKVHPFEFEFIVADNPFMQKIFNNLIIISNKAEPESFHFEIIGEGYNFVEDKKNMFYRQELTKEMFQQKMYKDILYNLKYKTLSKPIINVKSSFMPLYYERVSTYDEIYDVYQRMTSNGRDYQNLTGGEIVWDKQLNEFKVMTHQKGIDMKKNGRLRGNMFYKEDVWNVEIRPINFVQKNETVEVSSNDPIPIIVSRIPHYNHINLLTGKPYDNPNDYPDGSPAMPVAQPIPFMSGYNGHKVFLFDSGSPIDIDPIYLSKWSSRKEARLRDKHIRIKVRYSGNDLAVISAIKTMYTNSFS